ncbi:MAG: alkaline shock response membrane anchor protein AmaP [Candidatus Sumerlaeia bacterium]|nr:alkaline shock response membrane anchor protein AmaP [Candidatus Sumerlaeia bacterium]
MIRRLQIILITLCLILFFLLALALVFERSGWQPLETFGAQAIESIPPTLQMLILLAVLAAILLIGALTLHQLRGDVLITREGEEGTVTIVESAIRRYIRQVAMDMGAVRKVRTRITNTPQGLAVDLFANVIVTDTLVKIEQTIRSRVREALEQTLGVGGVASINVIVENFEKVREREEPSEEGVTLPPAREPAGQERAAEPTQYVHLVHRPEVTDVPSESAVETSDARPTEENR